MATNIQSVLIDTDMGWDDVMSILLMLKNPDVKIVGITVTGCGETHLPDGVDIARRLLALTNNTAPVCAGAAVPSNYDHVFPATFRADMDNVMGLRSQLPAPVTPLDPRSATQLMLDVLETSNQPVTIISLGGLTNITAMLPLASQSQLANIASIAIMGGAIQVGGNVAALNNAKPEWNQGPIYSTNVVAEWNIFIDAMAAKRAFCWTEPPLPLSLVTLDACNNVMLSMAYADMITATDPVATFLKGVITAKTGPSAEPGGVAIFDPLATVYGIGMLADCTVETLAVDVLDTDSVRNNTCGWTIIPDNPAIPLKKVVTSASANEFQGAFQYLANLPMPNQA